MLKFHIVNNDVCVRLMLTGEDVRTLLLKNHWQETGDIQEAQVILINTCSFLKKSEDKAAGKIEKIIKEKRLMQKVVVFGCLPDINPMRLKKLHPDFIFSGRDIEPLLYAFGLKNFEREIGHHVVRPGSLLNRIIKRLNRWFLHDDYFTYLFDKEKVYHLKISEGCLGKCTYCAERLARGTLKSKLIAEVVKEFRAGLKKDFRIFSLNADDVGLYGQDNRQNIARLLKIMLRAKRDFRLVLTEFNPLALVKYEKELVKLLGSPKIIFITVPLESGSQKIIEAMKRPYAVSQVMPILQRIRQKNRKLKINTHIIVGFPGETAEDFRDTQKLFERFYFNKIKVFQYSERLGTEAALMPDKIPGEEIIRRQKSLKQQVFRQALGRFDIKAIILNIVGF